MAVSHKGPMTIKNLERFWDTESLGITEDTQTSNLTKEENDAQILQDKYTFYNKEQKRWTTSLLWKEDPPNLGNNKAKALAILKQVENGALKRGSVDAVNAAFQDMIDGGFAEEVFEDEEPENVHYLPCHAVYRDDHDTTKTRIVLNGASITQSGKSINECLYQGRCLLPEINHVLIRWRMYLIAFVLDISKMFLRIQLQHGKDHLRFFWRFCEKNLPPRIFRMIVVTFGIISSPFQAVDVVLKHADMLNDVYPLAAEEVRKQIYMDDVPGGDDEFETAKKKIEELWDFFQDASMMPHKFASNASDILTSIPEMNRNPNSKIKVLGVLWDSASDKLTFDIKLKKEESQESRNENSDTKRSFLEESATIFDPLGLLSPFVMKIKLLFQKVWLAEETEKDKKKKGWDTKLPHNIQNEWNSLKAEIPTLNEISIPRCFFTSVQKRPKKIEIFAFGDASNKAYATCVYLVGTHEDGTFSKNLVISKSRIAPKKMVEKEEEVFSIVRLELLAALITARAVTYVKKAFENTKYEIQETHCFTDSLINLCRIKNGPAKYKLWVANRLAEILTHTKSEQWRHCAGPQNPADLPSRGIGAEELKNSTMWWNGPDFITKDPSEWPTTAEFKISDDPETKKNMSEINFKELFLTSAATNLDLKRSMHIDFDIVLNIVNRFEKWSKMVTMLSFILRLGLKEHAKFRRQPKISAEEWKKTQDFLWSVTQRHNFKEDFQKLLEGKRVAESSKLSCYNPELDFDNYTIKSNTRLRLSNLPEETKKSIILPKNCPIVEKYILFRHELHQHAQTGYLHALMKDKFILPQGRNQIKKAIHKCCRRGCVKPRQLEQQQAPLPNERIDNPAPFVNVAVDLFGPLIVHHRCELEKCPHPNESKVHVALFTCFHSRAVHLEVVDNTGTEAFLNAFRLFTARRGSPEQIYSDNAKGFTAASKEVRRLYRSVNWDTVAQEGVRRDINWFFSCEQAPHQNGLCERLVRTVKTPLRIVVGNAKLTMAQLRIILTEVEAVVNNRPLGVTSNDPNDFTPITPMELVNGRKLEHLPDPNLRKNVTSFQHLWRKRQSVLNGFWARWQKDYLVEQNIRRKWKAPTKENLIGEIVLIREDNKLSRNEWKLGRIIEVHPSKDGLIRNVTVKTATSKIRRPVQKLAVFENFRRHSETSNTTSTQEERR